MALKMNLNFDIEYVSDSLKYNDNLKFLDLEPVTKKVVELKDVYIVVDDIYGNKQSVTFNLKYYSDDSKSNLIKVEKYTFEPDQKENALRWDKQCYLYIKNLKEFEAALDV